MPCCLGPAFIPREQHLHSESKEPSTLIQAPKTPLARTDITYPSRIYPMMSSTSASTLPTPLSALTSVSNDRQRHRTGLLRILNRVELRGNVPPGFFLTRSSQNTSQGICLNVSTDGLASCTVLLRLDRIAQYEDSVHQDRSTKFDQAILEFYADYTP